MKCTIASIKFDRQSIDNGAAAVAFEIFAGHQSPTLYCGTNANTLSGRGCVCCAATHPGEASQPFQFCQSSLIGANLSPVNRGSAAAGTFTCGTSITSTRFDHGTSCWKSSAEATG